MALTRRQMIVAAPLALAACAPSRAALLATALDAPGPALAFSGRSPLPAAHLPRATKPRVTAFSGGGPDGALGAGYAVGQAEHGARAPDIVTGVSIGALVGTLAFAGASGALTALFAEGGLAPVGQDYSGSRALTRGSIGSGAPYAAAIDATVTDEIVARIAAEHARGRRLFVATTDFEANTQVVWDIGALAAIPGPGTGDFLRRAVLASASIPGVFPPVALAEPGAAPRLYVDGGVTAQFYLPDMPRGRAISQALVVIDNQLDAQTRLPRYGIFDVAEHGLSSLIRSQSRTQLELEQAEIARAGGRMQVVAIPDTLPEARLQDWQSEPMRRKFEAGRAMAR